MRAAVGFFAGAPLRPRALSRSGSRTRRSHAPCHSQAASHAGQDNTIDPPDQASASMVVWS